MIAKLNLNECKIGDFYQIEKFKEMKFLKLSLFIPLLNTIIFGMLIKSILCERIINKNLSFTIYRKYSFKTHFIFGLSFSIFLILNCIYILNITRNDNFLYYFQIVTPSLFLVGLIFCLVSLPLLILSFINKKIVNLYFDFYETSQSEILKLKSEVVDNLIIESRNENNKNYAKYLKIYSITIYHAEGNLFYLFLFDNQKIMGPDELNAISIKSALRYLANKRSSENIFYSDDGFHSPVAYIAKNFKNYIGYFSATYFFAFILASLSLIKATNSSEIKKLIIKNYWVNVLYTIAGILILITTDLLIHFLASDDIIILGFTLGFIGSIFIISLLKNYYFRNRVFLNTITTKTTFY